MDRTNRMNRLRNILAAGALTVLVLITVLALSPGDASPVGSATQAATDSAPAAVVDDLRALDEQAQLAILKAQNQQLEAALQTMLDREVEYQNQLEVANQTILQLQRKQAPAYGDEDEQHEHGEGGEYEDD